MHEISSGLYDHSSLFSDQIEDLTPEKYASAFSQMTFSWVDPLMRLGWKKQLFPSDLWTLKTNNRSSIVVPQWDKYFEKAKAKNGLNMSILGTASVPTPYLAGII